MFPTGSCHQSTFFPARSASALDQVKAWVKEGSVASVASSQLSRGGDWRWYQPASRSERSTTTRSAQPAPDASKKSAVLRASAATSTEAERLETQSKPLAHADPCRPTRAFGA